MFFKNPFKESRKFTRNNNESKVVEQNLKDLESDWNNVGEDFRKVLLGTKHKNNNSTMK